MMLPLIHAYTIVIQILLAAYQQSSVRKYVFNNLIADVVDTRLFQAIHMPMTAGVP